MRPALLVVFVALSHACAASSSGTPSGGADGGCLPLDMSVQRSCTVSGTTCTADRPSADHACCARPGREYEAPSWCWRDVTKCDLRLAQDMCSGIACIRIPSAGCIVTRDTDGGILRIRWQDNDALGCEQAALDILQSHDAGPCP